MDRSLNNLHLCWRDRNPRGYAPPNRLWCWYINLPFRDSHSSHHLQSWHSILLHPNLRQNCLQPTFQNNWCNNKSVRYDIRKQHSSARLTFNSWLFYSNSAFPANSWKHLWYIYTNRIHKTDQSTACVHIPRPSQWKWQWNPSEWLRCRAINLPVQQS